MKKLLIILFLMVSSIIFGQSDDCAGATNLPVNATCVNYDPPGGGVNSPSNNEDGKPEIGAPTPSCAVAIPGSDVWFTIIGTGGNVNLSINNLTRNGTLAVWSNCPATIEIGCVSVLAGNSGSIIFPTIAATIYYVQIQRQSGGNNANMTFDICATNISSSAPPNDNPCAATPLPVNTSCVLTNTTNLNATNTTGVPAPGCASYAGGDVWYSFVVPASGSVSVESFANSLSDGGMAIYTGVCGALTFLSCDDDSGSGLMPALSPSGLTVGSTVFIRFWEFGNNANGTFGICVTAGTPAAGNQNCSTATQICNDAAFSGNSNGFATQDLNAANQGCLSSEHQSSWYWFQPSTAGTFSMAIRPASGVDYDFAIWGPYNTLTCPPNTVPLRCSFASGFSTSFESVQPSPQDYATGLSANGNGNGNAVGPTDGSGTDILDGWSSPITVGAANVGDFYIMLIDNFTANTTAFNIDLTFASGLTLNCTPLPIELLSFTVENIDNENVVNWVTASERNNDYFTIEHSTDGYNWKILSKIDGGGTTTSGNMYEYIDDNYLNVVNYYRLKQTDFDGASEYFNIVAVDNFLKHKEIYKIYNMMGQEVGLDYVGLKIIHYTDNTTEKRL